MAICKNSSGGSSGGGFDVSTGGGVLEQIKLPAASNNVKVVLKRVTTQVFFKKERAHQTN